MLWDGYAHELASRIADQKKKKKQEKKVRKKKTKQENKLRTRVDTPETDRPDTSTFGDGVLSAPMVDQEFGVVLCDVSSGSGVVDRISEAHGDELMLRALDLRKRGHPDKASYLLQLLIDIVQVESAGQNRQNRWLTQDDSRRDRAQEHINRCALDDLAKIYKECVSSSTAKSSSAPESLPYKSYVELRRDMGLSSDEEEVRTPEKEESEDDPDDGPEYLANLEVHLELCNFDDEISPDGLRCISQQPHHSRAS